MFTTVGSKRAVQVGSNPVKILSALIVCALLALGPGLRTAYASGTIRYVAPGGLVSGACASWANACELQYALSVAGSGDQIWAKLGTYKPTTTTDRTVSFDLKSGVAIYGGFAGTETLLSQRNFTANVTTLSGDIGILGNNSDNTYDVVSGGGTDSSAILDGLTITAGNANCGCFPGDFGGGVMNYLSSPTLRNLIITGNTTGGGGGGIYDNGSSPTLINVNINNNSVNFFGNGGAGMYNDSSSPSLTNVTFTGNTTPANGAGMYDASSSTPTLTNVTFNTNSATGVSSLGGGIYNTGSSPILTAVTFVGNTADSGGGMYDASSSNPTLTKVTFNTNTAGSYGGGMEDNFSSPTLSKVVFENNSATNQEGGGMYITNNSAPTLTNVTFSGNSASNGGAGIYFLNSDGSISDGTFSANTTSSNGGGIYDYQSSPALRNLTFNGNSADMGAAMYNYSSNPAVTNATFSGNAATTSTGGMYNDTGSGPTIHDSIFWNDSHGEFLNVSALMGINDSIVSGGCPSGATCSNIITSDPHLGALSNNGGFAETMAISSGSPALDAGNDSSCASTDERGVARPKGAHCDIGAYEAFGIPPSFADVPSNYWAWKYIEALYQAGITGGCSTVPLDYCPTAAVTRDQMAVFLLKGEHGSSYSPPAVGGSTGFNDVSISYWAAAWIKQLAAEGVTGGCGGGNYCPTAAVTRDQMAVFLLKAEHGSSYSPPAVGGSTGFNDVSISYWAAAWIKQLAAEGITGGCGGGNYCPTAAVTRDQMAVFLQRVFSLPLP